MGSSQKNSASKRARRKSHAITETEHQNKWPHLPQFSFSKPANNLFPGLKAGREKALGTRLKCNGISLNNVIYAGPKLQQDVFNVPVHLRRVVHNLRSRDNRKGGIELSPEEIKDAEEEIVSLAQREAFRHEYAALSLSKPLPQKSQLIKLTRA